MIFKSDTTPSLAITNHCSSSSAKTRTPPASLLTKGVLIATRKHHQAILLELAEEACGNSIFILKTQFITPRKLAKKRKYMPAEPEF